MDTLPVEVAEDIFKYLLSLEDRKSASQVCQQWYRAYLNRFFRNSEVVNITADRQFLKIVQLENFNREYYHFVMKNIDITESSTPFWERFGPFIKTLTFHGCYIREKMFVTAISNCTRIESLEIHDCKELLMSGLLLENDHDQQTMKKALQNLKSICFSYNRYLSDAILMKILDLCPNLTKLNLKGCQISYHNGMFKKFYPNGLKTPSESVTTFQMVMKYVSAHSNKIKELAFSDTLLDSNSLNDLSMTKNLELDVLHMRSCMQLSNQGFLQMCGHLTTMTELDIGYCRRITDTSLIAVCSSLPRLTKLSVQGCRAITDAGIVHIMQLKGLQSLNASECEMIDGEGLVHGLCRKPSDKIVELRLSHLGYIPESVVVAIAESLPNLRHLDLGFCYNAVTDTSIQAVFRHCKWLRYLNVAMCDRFTDCGLTGMGVSKRPIGNTADKYLRLPLGSKQELAIIRDANIKQDVREMCESDMLSAFKSGVTLSSLCGLQFLNLSGCNRVSDVSLKYAFTLPELKSLNMSHCQQISTEGLSCLVQNCPAIEDINLDQCQNVTDEGVECVVRDLHRLKSLVLGSNKITNQIGVHIANSSLRFQYIDLRHCSKVTGSGVGHLYRYLPFLQTFHYLETIEDNEDIFPPAPAPIGFWLRRP